MLQWPTSNFCKPLKNKSEGCPSNQVSAAAMPTASDGKWRTFNCFFGRIGLRTYQHLCIYLSTLRQISGQRTYFYFCGLKFSAVLNRTPQGERCFFICVRIPSQENMTTDVKYSVSMRVTTYCARVWVPSGRRFTSRALRCGHTHSHSRVIFTETFRRSLCLKVSCQLTAIRITSTRCYATKNYSVLSYSSLFTIRISYRVIKKSLCAWRMNCKRQMR